MHPLNWMFPNRDICENGLGLSLNVVSPLQLMHAFCYGVVTTTREQVFSLSLAFSFLGLFALFVPLLAVHLHH